MAKLDQLQYNRDLQVTRLQERVTALEGQVMELAQALSALQGMVQNVVDRLAERELL